jgi:hypothetical protein
MINNGKELLNLLDGIYKSHGFIKKKDAWYLHTKECICFFSIGKSPFGGHYDHVMGAFLKEIDDYGNDDFPKYNLCHLKYHLGEIVKVNQIKKVFDLENKSFTGDEREAEIIRIVSKYVIPFLIDVSTIKGIKSAKSIASS